MHRPSAGEIFKMLSYIHPNEHEYNTKLIIDTFKCYDVNEKIEGKTLLHFFASELYPKSFCYGVIETLLNDNVDPNEPDTEYGDNFIQTAIRHGYNKRFIMEIIVLSLKYGLDINHQNNLGQTIMHMIVGADDYELDVNFYNFLRQNGFDCNKFNNGFELLRLVRNKKDGIEQDDENFDVDTFMDSVENQKLEKFGTILTKKRFLTNPTIGREKEIKNLMITLAQDKKSAIIVGEAGVGKTAIVDELAYRIQNNNVPKFLKNRIILEVDPSVVVAGCRCVGDFEENMNELIKVCQEYNIILFIDEIHTIYGMGSSRGKDNDMAAMLKKAIDRSGLKVIGATTETEYYEYFGENALKRRFDKIKVLEPENEVLFQIIDKVLRDQAKLTEINFKDDSLIGLIANIIIKATAPKHRVYTDKVNNPDLAVSIIDRAFAIAKIEDSDEITVDHFIQSFQICERIYDLASENAIKELTKLSSKPKVEKGKVLAISFNR